MNQTAMNRTGIDPDLCPGGIVVRHYRRSDGEILLEQKLGPDSDIGNASQIAADLHAARPGDITVRAYDGDTGERLRLELPRLTIIIGGSA